MYPYISDLINDLLGTHLRLPIKTFGFFLAMAFVAAYVVLKRELKRREKLGHFKMRTEKVRLEGPMSLQEVIIPTLVWGLVGYKLGYMFVDYELFYAHTDEALLSMKGFWLTGVLAAGIMGFLKYREYNQKKDLKEKFQEILVGPSYYLGPVVTLAFIGGIVGSKVFAMMESSYGSLAEVWEAFIDFSGLSFLGGLIMAGGMILFYLHRKGFNLWTSLDGFVPSIILAYAVGRIGCQLSGDGDWGIPNLADKPEWMAFLPDWIWSFDYPHNVAYSRPTIPCDLNDPLCNYAIPIQGCEGLYCTKLARPVFPTPFYETLLGLGIFGILMFLRTRLKWIGQVTGVYLMLIGLERFMIESIRVNDHYRFLGLWLSQAQIIALFLMLGGVGILVFRTMRKVTPPDTLGKPATANQE